MDELDILYGPLLRKNPNEDFINHYNKKIELDFDGRNRNGWI